MLSIDFCGCLYVYAQCTPSTLSTVDKIERVAFDFVDSVYTRSTLYVRQNVDRLSQLSTKSNELNMFNFDDKVQRVVRALTGDKKNHLTAFNCLASLFFLNVIVSCCHHSLCMYVCYVYFNKDRSIIDNQSITVEISSYSAVFIRQKFR